MINRHHGLCVVLLVAYGCIYFCYRCTGMDQVAATAYDILARVLYHKRLLRASNMNVLL